MKKLVTFPIQCGDEVHCVDLDTMYNARVRSHTKEDIEIEQTVRDLCPDYEGAGCIKFLNSLSSLRVNFEDHRDRDYSGKSHGVSLLWMLYADDGFVPYHVKALCYAQCMKYLIKKNWLLSFSKVDVVYDYLDELIGNDGRLVSFKVASNGLGAQIYRVAPDVMSSHITREWVSYFESYVNRTMVYRVNSILGDKFGFSDRCIMDDVTGFYNMFFEHVTPGVLSKAVEWYDTMIANAISEYARKLGCG